MKKIIPYLWCVDNAQELVEFYTSLFQGSEKGQVITYTESGAEVSGMKQGSVMSVEFKLCGQDFVALNGGEVFKFSPAVSLSVSCETDDEIEQLWNKLSTQGSVLMPLGEYPFSKKYGFLTDRFGVSWQLSLNGEKQNIVPSLIFVDQKFGQAANAMADYKRIFKGSEVLIDERFKGEDRTSTNNVLYGLLSINGSKISLMDGEGEHGFSFTGGISLLVDCEDQAEIDHLWKELSDGGTQMPCGWVSDKYGVHWQVFANSLGKYLNDPDKTRAEHALQAMFGMTKIDIEAIKKAHAGE